MSYSRKRPSSPSIFPYKTEWIYEADKDPEFSPNELKFGRIKALLYEGLYDSVTQHDLFRAFQIIKLVMKEKTLDPYALIRLIFILIETNETNKVDANIIIFLESMLNKLDLCKPEAFVEFLTYFVRNKRFDDAQEMLKKRQNYISMNIHRRLPLVDTNLKCYEFIFSYMEWTKAFKKTGSLPKLDVSTQGRLVNAIDSLKSISANYDYFVLHIMRMLLHYKQFNKAYLFASEFQRRNPYNLTAQLLLFNLLSDFGICLPTRPSSILEPSRKEQKQNRESELVRLTNFSNTTFGEDFNLDHYPTYEDMSCIIDNLRRLDPSRKEIMTAESRCENLIQNFVWLMDGLEVISEVRNFDRWSKLLEVLEKILVSGDEVVHLASYEWQYRYKRYWRNIDFVELASPIPSKFEEDLINDVMHILNQQLNCSMN